MFVGYQAIGTLGRQIVDGMDKVRILGQMYKVKARIAKLNGFSAHADRDELLQWLSAIKNPPRQLFVVHGEEEVSSIFAEYVRGKLGWKVSVPQYKDEVMLD
jgi:metallo-beta-lactamase family protein